MLTVLTLGDSDRDSGEGMQSTHWCQILLFFTLLTLNLTPFVSDVHNTTPVWFSLFVVRMPAWGFGEAYWRKHRRKGLDLRAGVQNSIL